MVVGDADIVSGIVIYVGYKDALLYISAGSEGCWRTGHIGKIGTKGDPVRDIIKSGKTQVMRLVKS